MAKQGKSPANGVRVNRQADFKVRRGVNGLVCTALTDDGRRYLGRRFSLIPSRTFLPCNLPAEQLDLACAEMRKAGLDVVLYLGRDDITHEEELQIADEVFKIEEAEGRKFHKTYGRRMTDDELAKVTSAAWREKTTEVLQKKAVANAFVDHITNPVNVKAMLEYMADEEPRGGGIFSWISRMFWRRRQKRAAKKILGVEL